MMKPRGQRVGPDAKPVSLGGFEAAYVEAKKPSILKALAKRLAALVFVGLVLAGLVIFGADRYVRILSDGRTHDNLEAIEPGRAAVVPGTSPLVRDGRENLYFNGRIAAAAELYHAGRVEFIIVSGDNEHDSYNEPRAMWQALVAAGVPGDRVVFDFAGFRTLDTIVRAREVFGQERIVVVSQKFHNERAICLARHFGIDAVGFNAPGPARGRAWWRNWARERLARVQLLLDLYVLDTQPRFLGPLEDVPDGQAAPADATPDEGSGDEQRGDTEDSPGGAEDLDAGEADQSGGPSPG